MKSGVLKLWAACVATVGFFTVGCQPGAELPQIKNEDISFKIGLTNNATSSSWSTARLRVKNTGADFSGVLDVEGLSSPSSPQQPSPVLYHMKLEIPGKSTAPRELSFPILAERWEKARAVLKQPGYSRDIEVDLRQPEDEVEGPARHVLLIGESFPDLTPLRASMARSWQLKGPDHVLLHKIASKDIAVHSTAYDEHSLVIIYGSSLAEAPDGAVDALIRWVERGGTLLAFPGAEWTSGLSERARRLFGTQLGPGKEVPDEIRWKLGPSADEGFFADLKPAASTRKLSSGLLLKSRLGSGQVFTSAFSPTGERFPAPSLARALHAALATVFAAARPETPARISADLESAAERCLRRLASFQTPPRSSVIWGLGIYLAVGFFLPWILFRALKRPEWTYAVVVVASVGFTFAIYRYGLLSALQQPELEELTILRVHPDGNAAEATSFVGVMSPSASRVSLFGENGVDSQSPLAAALPKPFLESRRKGQSWTTGLLEEQHVIEVDRAGRLRLDALALHPNELRSVRYDYRLDDRRLWEATQSLATSTLSEAQEAIGAAKSSGPTCEVTGSRSSIFPGARQVTRRHSITLVLREVGDADEPELDGK